MVLSTNMGKKLFNRFMNKFYQYIVNIINKILGLLMVIVL